jgi:hypothetical protein
MILCITISLQRWVQKSLTHEPKLLIFKLFPSPECCDVPCVTMNVHPMMTTRNMKKFISPTFLVNTVEKDFSSSGT